MCTTYLNRVFASQQVNDFEAVLDNTDSHQLLTIVTAVHHKGVHHTFDNWALCLAKAFNSITASSVW